MAQKKDVFRCPGCAECCDGDKIRRSMKALGEATWFCSVANQTLYLAPGPRLAVFDKTEMEAYLRSLPHGET